MRLNKSKKVALGLNGLMNLHKVVLLMTNMTVSLAFGVTSL
jgi:hypothetical protein